MRQYAQKFPVLIPVFFAPLGETSVTDRIFRPLAILPSFVACLILLSRALINPLNQYGKAQNGLFFVMSNGHSFIQPRPSMTDALAGTIFQFTATVRFCPVDGVF